MKRYITIAIFALALILAGCKEIQKEIDELYNEVEELKKTDAEFKRQLDGFNNSLTSLQTIIAALQSGSYIKSMMPLMEDSRQVGYIFTLSSGETFTVRDGKDGKDGYMPMVGVKCDDHGNYWWTLDEEFLLDASGNKVKADGVVPQFDIVDGFWNVSYDNGKTWVEIGKANGTDGADGKNGDSLFSEIEYTEGANVVKFILADGTPIILPCFQAISISFNVEDNTTSIAAGETIKVDYSLSYGDERTVVTASTDGNFIAKVIKKNDVSGTIVITCPGLYMDGYVNVMAFDGVGYSSVAVINFFEKEMSFSSDLNYNVDTEAGRISVPVRYNFEYYVEVEGDAKEWIKLDEKTKTSCEEGEIAFTYSENTGSARTGVISIYPVNTVNAPYAKITVNQRAAYFDFIEGSTSVVASSEGGTMERIRIQSSRGLMASSDAAWAQCSMTETEPHVWSLIINVSRNEKGLKRSCQIPIYAEDDKSVLATISVFQMDEGGNDKLDLVFEVRVGEMNDFTAFLPVGRMDGSEFQIDWGDGELDSSNDKKFENDGFVYHKYETGGEATTYDVRITGKVTRICSDRIGEGLRSSIVAVKQWGNVGIHDMSHAFAGFTSLERLAEDDQRGLSSVVNFGGAFERCPRLVSIPSGLFRYASRGEYFDNLFYRCEALKEVPDGLFSNCPSAVSFHETFRECRSLERIGNGVFNGCTNVESFEFVFLFTNIKVIPSDLFRDAVSAKNFHGVFEGCCEIRQIPSNLFATAVCASTFESAFSGTSISSIPSELFSNNKDVDSFYGTFSTCRELPSIPVALFDNNRKVTNFNYAFEGCSQVSGETPYTMINGHKVHLYERYDYPDYFVTPIYHEGCFRGDDQCVDFPSIPESWL